MKLEIIEMRESRRNPEYMVLRLREFMEEADADFFILTRGPRTANHPVHVSKVSLFTKGQIVTGAKIVTIEVEGPVSDNHKPMEDGKYRLNQVVRAE